METRDVERALRRGFPVPGKNFRDELLERCLAVLGQDDGIELDDLDEGIVLDDATLELLSAAGDAYFVGDSDGLNDGSSC